MLTPMDLISRVGYAVSTNDPDPSPLEKRRDSLRFVYICQGPRSDASQWTEAVGTDGHRFAHIRYRGTVKNVLPGLFTTKGKRVRTHNGLYPDWRIVLPPAEGWIEVAKSTLEGLEPDDRMEVTLPTEWTHGNSVLFNPALINDALDHLGRRRRDLLLHHTGDPLGPVALRVTTNNTIRTAVIMPLDPKRTKSE